MGCEGCARAILMAFNIIFFLMGAVALGVGIWVVVDGTIFLDLLANIPNSSTYGKLITDAAYILIGAGALIFLIAFLGCCGAWKRNKCMLITYSIIIGVLLALQIATVVTAYFFYDKIMGYVTSDLTTALNSTYTSQFTDQGAGKWNYVPGNIVSKGIDAIQIEFTCCGINNYTDYLNGNFPASCCPVETTDMKGLIDKLWADASTELTLTAAGQSCPGNATYAGTIDGCADAIKNYVLDKSLIFIGVAGGTVGVQLLLILLSCCLFCAIRNEEHKA